MTKTVTAILAVVVLAAASADADYYRYRDSSGTVHYTNDAKSIPKHLRNKAVVVAKDAPRKKENPAPVDVMSAPADPAGSAAVSSPVAPAASTDGPVRHYAGSAAAVAACLILLIFAGKCAIRFGWSGGVKILRAAAVAGLLAYLAFTHLHDMLSLFSRVRKDLQAVQAPKAKQPLPEELHEIAPAEPPPAAR